jgi:hypothetical protein
MNQMKCTVCKKEKNEDNFRKNKNGYTKTCISCLEKKKISRNKNKCIHGKQKSRCKDCGGIGICEHGKQKELCVECMGSGICVHKKQKQSCIDCMGSSICEHKIQKRYCIECNGSSVCEHKKQKLSCKICSDEIKITIKNWLSNSKSSDIKHKRFDKDNFIDKSLCQKMIDEQKTCFYCLDPVHYGIRDGKLGTIERFDNDIGHTKGNCVVACWDCNNRHKSRFV